MTLSATLRQASAVALAWALLGTPAGARADRYRVPEPVVPAAHSSALGTLVDVTIQVDGQSAPLYYRPGVWDRHYFEAFKGRNYSLVIRNKTARRVAVLIAVDGINVVNGEKSSLTRSEPMYVLDPYEQAAISGWRSSLQQVHRFVFVDERRSYATRTGQANGDLGWIRVLSFREIEPVVRYRQGGGWLDREDAREQAAPAPSTRKSTGTTQQLEGRTGDDLANRSEAKSDIAPESNPGTGWGQRQYDPVQRTEFNPERRSTDEIVLRYEYASGLRALNIYPQRDRLWDREDGVLSFARPPRR